MATNNEIGVNQPLKEIGNLCKQNGCIFHVDAAQGAYVNLDVVDNSIDLMSLSGHKFYGPKGIGALYVNQELKLKPTPIIRGGGQQSGYRSGTIPTFLTVGMGEAFELMKTLKEIHYDGSFAFETHKFTQYIPDEIIEEALKFSVVVGNYLLSLAK